MLVCLTRRRGISYVGGEGGIGNELNQADHEPVEDAPIVTVIQLLEYAL